MTHNRKKEDQNDRLKTIEEKPTEEECIMLTEAIVKQNPNNKELVDKIFSQAVENALINNDYETVGTIIGVASVCKVTINVNTKNK